MSRELKIDKAIYLVADETKTYKFVKRNLKWEDLTADQNEKNKKEIHGYTRILKNSGKKVFWYH